jgi:iron complex transport system permease protein
VLAHLSRRPGLVIVLLAIAATLTLVAAITFGSAGPGAQSLWPRLVEGSDPLARAIVLDLRLPRALTAFAVGGLLALAGVAMQVLLRNPLADPYVLGVSGGASVAALSAMLAGLSAVATQGAAFSGALGATLLVFGLSHGPGGWTPTRLLLTGVVVAAGTGALVSLLLAAGDPTLLRGMVYWLMGDLSWAGSPLPLWILLALAAVAGILVARPLNVLARGDVQAQLLGVAVGPLRVSLFVVSSLITAATVTTVGSIGFVGLVVPHLVRLVLGSDHRRVIPAAALTGGILVTLADLMARTALAPRQLPVGALTALVGVPLFLALLRRAQPTA